ncbi:UDP-4-amino-4-deoxy-L-arabinose--oxoglutarate aminotransferase [Legionella massiliensis]|uniref:UDP-4-amino-4-deoxy-L-arabinose--oxoglutarate aminotransferase n=1 Tax=Legionella massiliensis TaxID=1034943 RepID=A0A078KSV4_9GAMM|nr:dTDP-4-amino-4,6-dideoxygalactose transaminase [Legionella massiliensis]CDZ77505.1 UDP-4-amino-4-deoxy-L-arabinose--oxoglutarate aminotransferase [Legionella massiliensis]CEE13243.1 dTDP-4-amino-4,6-dideoxygalactose transaminase [Legionella massiliensis]
MILFNKPPFTGNEFDYMQQAVASNKISGDGEFTRRCNRWIEDQFNIPKALLTTSCTHALEMAAILADIQPGDEVIAPSYTFVSTVNAFVLRGAKIRFVDIRPDTLNLDENLIEQAITARTKAIVLVHYAGVACEMDSILALAKKYNLLVIEDAAQGVMATYKGRALGSIADMGAFSFHETKNYSMGEGGALLLNNPAYIERAEIIREKGTDRSKFFRGQVDKYSWCDLGSSYLPSDINAAYLWAQLELAHEINNERLNTWQLYYEGLSALEKNGDLELPFIPNECVANGHLFYIKTANLQVRTNLIKALLRQGCSTVFHYVPLHSAKAGKIYGEFVGEDNYTTRESERLLRLPLYYGLTEENVAVVIDKIYDFYGLRR